MLNIAFPDSLHVRTAVWMMQRDRALVRSEPTSAADSQPAAFRFEQIARYRATQAWLDAPRSRSEGESAIVQCPFSIAPFGPMLWTRFKGAEDTFIMAVPGSLLRAGGRT